MRRKKGLCFYHRRRRVSSDAVREIGNYIFGIGLAILMAFFLVYSFGMRTSVIGVSMENTLYNGQTILVNKIAYLLFPPKAGDVVVFLPNGNEKSHYYVRRVIAFPGDTVQIKEGAVYVNDELYLEEIEVSSIEEAGIASEPITLEDGEYFVWHFIKMVNVYSEVVEI